MGVSPDGEGGRLPVYLLEVPGDFGEQVPGEGEVRAAVESINRRLEQATNSLQFSVDRDNRVIVKVVDSATGEVIRQMPTEEALAISRSLDKLQGLLLDQEA